MNVLPDEVINSILRLGIAKVGVDAQRRSIATALEQGGSTDPLAIVGELVGALPDAAPAVSLAQVRHQFDALGARVLVPGFDGYPACLEQAWPELGAPLWLFHCGNVLQSSTRRPFLAVVGTRRPTADGVRTASAIAAQAAAAGAVVVSGLARGIDQAAHGAALEAGGATVAVLGTGFGVDYPHRSSPLRSKIQSSAGLYSELLPGAPPRPYHFLARNRIISGLADVTVVVEGRARSGALHTARMAAAQGRDVWAVPGSINAPASQAPLALIRDGANVVTRLDDVLEALTLGSGPEQGQIPGTAEDSDDLSLTEVQRQIVDLVGAVPISIDQLHAATDVPVATLMVGIGQLARMNLVEHGFDGSVVARHGETRLRGMARRHTGMT